MNAVSLPLVFLLLIRPGNLVFGIFPFLFFIASFQLNPNEPWENKAFRRLFPGGEKKTLGF